MFTETLINAKKKISNHIKGKQKIVMKTLDAVSLQIRDVDVHLDLGSKFDHF